MLEINMISAVDKNFGIGKDNQLLCKSPQDLKYFKELTHGHAVLMGRKTYESIGKLLSNRLNIILSKDKDYRVKSAIVINQHEDVFKFLYHHTKLFVIGGAEIYKHWINHPQLDHIYLTQFNKTFDADKFFPNIDEQQWQKTTIAIHDDFDFLKLSKNKH